MARVRAVACWISRQSKAWCSAPQQSHKPPTQTRALKTCIIIALNSALDGFMECREMGKPVGYQPSLKYLRKQSASNTAAHTRDDGPYWRTRAAAPAAMGVAMEVPDMRVRLLSRPSKESRH